MIRRIVRTGSFVAVLSTLVGCQGAIYGEGNLYLWNGSDHTVEFKIDGRTPHDTSLSFERGELLEHMVAGEYSVTPIKDGLPLATQTLTVSKDRLSVFNYRAIGCFARTDVAGMYKRDRARVRVLETYRELPFLDIKDQIDVTPGQRLPAEAPNLTSETAFQRLVVVPCALLDAQESEREIAEFVRRLR